MEFFSIKFFKFLGLFCCAVAKSFCILILELSMAFTSIGINFFFIYNIYNKLGQKVKKHRWTMIETNFLIENASIMYDLEIAKILKKSLKSVRRKRENLKLIKQNGRSVCNIIDQTTLNSPPTG